jgi:hypothetical protein
MGSDPKAHLAYGYELGTREDFKAAERDEYGSPKLPWLAVDEGGYAKCGDLAERAETLLLASMGFTEDDWRADGYRDRKREAENRLGVELAYSGADGYEGWMLVGLDSERSVEWSEAMTLDLDELTNRPAYMSWDDNLAHALGVLGITPTQPGPKWLVFPSYG